MKPVLIGGNNLNMTYLALNLSHYVNGAAKRHGEVSRLMFGGYSIEAITNGVRAATWTHQPFQELYDRYISGWREDNFSLRYAISIPKPEVWTAHRQAKNQLIDYVNRQTNAGMDADAFTIGFARRATAYKRGGLLFRELLRSEIKIAYLEEYDIELAKMITSGVDIWLNTPQPPLEAPGTSGMKAALNGVPSLSILDGWWIEGHIEGITGWSVGEDTRERERTVTGQEMPLPFMTSCSRSLYHCATVT